MSRLHSVSSDGGLRFAVISDIHGNYPALKAVMDDIRLQGIGLVVNLGDSLSGPLEPAKTADYLMRARLLTVRGNHDRALLEQSRAEMLPDDAFAADQLTARHRAWLATLPVTEQLWGRIFICHATPDDDTALWLDTPGPDGRLQPADRDHIERLAARVPHRLILTGHSHVARVVDLGDGRQIVNPGSVGCPGYGGTDARAALLPLGHVRASYAIIEEDAVEWDVTFRTVHYDTATQANKARLNRRPDWALALGQCDPPPHWREARGRRAHPNHRADPGLTPSP